MTYIETTEYYRDGYVFGTLNTAPEVRLDSTDTAEPFLSVNTAEPFTTARALMTRDQLIGLRDAIDHWLARH